MASNRAELSIILAVIAIIGAFYLSTLREGHVWGDDFSMYIHHAKNIALGIDYKDTGYIYNPAYPWLGPKTYPPGFPLLLSPIYKWYGLNLTAMKIQGILFFLGWLFLIFFIVRNSLPFQYSVALIAIFGLNPFFWNFKDVVVSDMPFAFSLYLTLLFLGRVYRSNTTQTVNYAGGLLAGLLICLSVGIRTVGIVLLPAVFIYDLIKARRPTGVAVTATFVAAFVFLVKVTVLGNDSSYLDQFPADGAIYLQTLVSHARWLSIASSFSVLWDNGYSKILQAGLLVIISGFAAAGYLSRIRDRITFLEVFFVVYLVTIVVLVGRGTRYLIPVVPLFVFYVFIAIKGLNLLRNVGLERLAFFLVLGAVLFSYAGKYTKTDFGPISEGIGKKETKELFNYITENSRQSDVFIFSKPRALALFTERKASVYHRARDDRDLWNYFEKINASYIIVAEQFPGDRLFLRPFVARHESNLKKVFSNADFEVYGIEDGYRRNRG